MESDEVIKGYELERERMIIQSKTNKARKEGKEVGLREGEQKERYYNVQQLIDFVYGEQETEWLKECSFEQLSKAFILAKKGYTYEEFKQEMLK